MNTRAKILVVIAVLAVAGGGFWWSGRHKGEGPLVLQGNVEVRQVNLGFKVAGRIAQLDVDEGDTVVAGKKLASLDKVYFTDALRQLRAQREQFAANLAKMVAGNRPEEISQAEANVADREASLANMQLTVERAQKLLEKRRRDAKGL